jgi:hypothetical protein
VLQAVLSSPQHTPLHDAALGVLALHVAPGLDIPRQQSLRLLYTALAVIPAFRCEGGWGGRGSCCSALAAACRGRLQECAAGVHCEDAA